MDLALPSSADTYHEFDMILRERAIGFLFQPIVSLRSGHTVGYEALARGPTGSSLYPPDALFRHAALVGRMVELDWVCRGVACRTALAANPPVGMPLFVNIEPTSSRTLCPPDLIGFIRTALDRLQIVAEVTERSVTTDPGGLMAAVERLRRQSARVAIDDVGAHGSSLAMMSLLRPDVIKLDRHIIQGQHREIMSPVVNAVRADAERHGAIILAEGIETPHHRAVAQSIGATLGQGWLFGRPEPLPRHIELSGITLPRLGTPAGSAQTPFEVARRRRPVGCTTKEMLVSLSNHLEHAGITASDPTVLLASFQQARFFTGRTRHRYRDAAARGAFTAVYAQAMPPDPAPGIRGRALSPDDPLVDEWVVIVLGEHFAGGLFAKDRLSQGSDRQRLFDYVVSYDRDLIIDAARPLLRRLGPDESGDARI